METAARTDYRSLHEYADALRQSIGSTYVNTWSPTLFGPHYPIPLVGYKTEINQDVIRQYIEAIGNLNPLYHDPDYARSTRHGGIVAPATVLYAVAYTDYDGPNAPPSPKFPSIYGGDEFQWRASIRIGDRIDFTTVFPSAVEIKETRNQGTVAFVHGWREFRRRGGEAIATCDFWKILRQPEQAKALSEKSYRALDTSSQPRIYRRGPRHPGSGARTRPRDALLGGRYDW